MDKGLRKWLRREEAKARHCHVNMASLTESEQAFVRLAHQKGWIVHRPSWPDFICIDDKGEVHFVEVKGPGDFIRTNQRRTLDLLLEKLGINVRVWHQTSRVMFRWSSLLGKRLPRKERHPRMPRSVKPVVPLRVVNDD